MALTSRTTGASSVALLELLEVDLLLALDQLDVFVRDLREHLVVVGALVVQRGDGGADRAGGGDGDLDVVAGEELDLVDGDQVGRIGHRQGQRRTGQADRHQVVAARQRRRDEADHLGRDVHRHRIDEREAVLLLQQGRQLGVGEDAQVDQRRTEGGAFLALVVLDRLLELREVDQTAFDEQLSETRAH